MATVKENTETITRSRLVGLKDICVIGVNADLETTAEKVGVESPVNILDTLGITQGELDSIKGVLARYE